MCNTNPVADTACHLLFSFTSDSSDESEQENEQDDQEDEQNEQENEQDEQENEQDEQENEQDDQENEQDDQENEQDDQENEQDEQENEENEQEELDKNDQEDEQENEKETNSEEICSETEDIPQKNKSYYKKHWDTIPTILRETVNPFPMDAVENPFLTIPEDKLLTMDATSKCWKNISNKSECLLQQEPDGITWAICEECVTQIPLQIQHAIYFFHSLQSHVQDYTGYAAESKNIVFKRDGRKTKVITKLLWNYSQDTDMGVDEDSDDDIDMTRIMQERCVFQGGSNKREVSPLKIRRDQ